jgi:Tetracyclin repressor-like, C-terminal domain
VPGYAAPDDTIEAAARTPVVLLRILADGVAASTLGTAWPPADRAAARLTAAVRADLERARADVALGVPDEVMLTALAAWTQLFGMVSFELFGQFNRVIEERAEFFDQQAELMGDVIGL